VVQLRDCWEIPKTRAVIAAAPARPQGSGTTDTKHTRLPSPQQQHTLQPPLLPVQRLLRAR